MTERLPIMRPDATQQVFNGISVSYGIAPILSTFSTLSGQFKKPYWNLFLINVETIIRDCKEDGNDKVLAQKTLTDCTVLAQYIAAYCRISVPSQLKERPIICFYLPHYENIPKIYLRDKFPKGTEERWEVRDEIEKILARDGFPTSFDSTQVLFLVVGTKGAWPHRELASDLCKQIDAVRYRKVLMISHVPSDFHLYRVFGRDFNILESYTGAIKNQKQFGKKVFGNDAVPFLKYTHLLYGDKYYLKAQVPIKTKRQINELAAKEHWSILPEKSVLQSLIRLNPVQSDLYVKPDI